MDEKTEQGSDSQMSQAQHDQVEQRMKSDLAKERAEDLTTAAVDTYDVVDVDDSTDDISGDKSQVERD